MLQKFFSVSFILLLSISCTQTHLQTFPLGSTFKLTVLHTNDHHGRFWKNKNGEVGLAAQMTLIKAIREEVKKSGGHVLLLSAGDINAGTPRSDLLDAEPDFKGMSFLGYDALALGNHEFDKPNEVLYQQMKWSSFPFLSANIFKKNTDQLAFTPYLLKDFNGNKVAILGLTTESTENIGKLEATKNFDFRSSIESARNFIPNLSKESIFLIVLSHLGYYSDARNSANDVELAKAVHDINLIVGGHSHTALFQPERVGDTYIVQAGDHGRYLGRADFEISENQPKLIRYELIPINLKPNPQDPVASPVEPIAEDPQVLELLRAYYEKSDKLLTIEVGDVDVDFIARDVENPRETNLGRLVARSQMDLVEADVGLINSGGLRANLDKGKITYEDILTVLPFSNTVTTVEFTGRELKDYLETLFQLGKTTHFSGVRGFIREKKILELWVGGKKIETSGTSTATYRMALCNFMARGGSNYPDVSTHASFSDSGHTDAHALNSFVKKHRHIHRKDYSEPSFIFK